jgi:hypothetical protein
MHLMILFLTRALAVPTETMNIVLVFPLIWSQVLEELEVGSLAMLQRPYPGKEVVSASNMVFQIMKHRNL